MGRPTDLDAEDPQRTVLERLRQLTEEEGCALLGVTRQYLWQMLAVPARRRMSLKLFARAVSKLGLGDQSPIHLSLVELHPAEFRAPRRKKRRAA